MLADPRFQNYSSYIMTAYVKFMEAAGAQVVPLIVNDSSELDKLSTIDGILMPGGEGDYLDFGKQIFDAVMAYNDAGHFYPIWGTCLGFENMAIYAADAPDSVLSKIEVHNLSLPLDFMG